MSRIAIVVGTVYGNARAVAEQIAEVLCLAGHQVEVLERFERDNLIESRPQGLIVCTSTTGQGDVPDNLSPLFHGLQERTPTLSDIHYAVVALGDSSYGDSFAQAGRSFDSLLAKLQAVQLVPPLMLDAGEPVDAEEVAADWAVRLAPLFEE